ncbi:uncharacterized protein PRCAT00002301001 [Priceomyces carsonii]|uniref:uncharacterized protein n=1 Tax=Priceomyces carsonii TaxID=28549 RepID=UPI002EDABC96|nr:unnamed protein product [Priceomyces carsonii]
MLRRPATTIKLTPEDILEYDDSLEKQKEESKESQEKSNLILQEQVNDSNHDFKDTKGMLGTILPQAVGQTRDDRIGVNRNTSN